jgi:hypothetical protein
MLEKGFLRNQTNENTKLYRITLIASKTLLYLGTLVLIGSFLYLLFNWEKSNVLIGMLMPFLVAGLGLIFVSRLILRGFRKLRR